MVVPCTRKIKLQVTIFILYLLRLENLAQQIESEYEKFDSWHNKCSSLNQWLSESERLIKQEEKASTDVETVKYQIQDNKVSWARGTQLARARGETG